MQLQWHVQKDREKQAHSEVLFPACRSYIALIDMGKIIRHNPYKWSDYVQKVSSIIFRHNNATHIICVNDPYDTAYSTKDDKQDLRVQGRAHVPNIYMTHSHLLEQLCGTNNKGRLICKHLTQSAEAEIVYSVGSDCTNLSTRESNECRITVSVSLRQTPFSFLHTLYCLQWARCR